MPMSNPPTRQEIHTAACELEAHYQAMLNLVQAIKAATTPENAPPAAPFYAVQGLTYTILEGSRPISEAKYDSLYSSGGVTTT